MRKRTLLRVLRAAHEPKIGQREVARAAGITHARYWQIENGDGSEPSDDEKKRVAAALGVSVSEIAWPERDVRASA